MKSLNLDSKLLLCFIALTALLTILPLTQLDIFYGFIVLSLSGFVFVRNLFKKDSESSVIHRGINFIGALAKSLFYVTFGLLFFSLEGGKILGLITALLFLLLVFLEHILNDKQDNNKLIDYILHWGSLGFLYGFFTI